MLHKQFKELVPTTTTKSKFYNCKDLRPLQLSQKHPSTLQVEMNFGKLCRVVPFYQINLKSNRL